MRSFALAALLVLALAPTAEADAAKEFKRAWAEAARQMAEAKALRKKKDAQGATQLEEQAGKKQEAAVKALARGGNPACAELLVKTLVDPNLDHRAVAAAEAGLHGMTDPEVALWASKGLEGEERDPAKRVVLCAFLSARAEEDPGTGMLLLPALEDKQPKVQAAAIRGLSAVRRKVVVSALVRLLDRSEGRVRGDCGRALQRLTGKSMKTDEWVGWWAAKEGSFSFDGSSDDDAGSEDEEGEGGRFSTVTRLEPPGKPGATIYNEVDSQRIVFVVDFSGSMRTKCKDTSGRFQSRLEYVKTELITVIMSELTEESRFNIVAFSTKLLTFKKKLVKATKANKGKARTWIRRALRPDGETNIYDALEAAFKHKDADTIYFLTDGNPTFLDHHPVKTNDGILGKVRKWNTYRGVRIHTIGFLAGKADQLIVENKGMAARFLKSLAKQNDGSFRAFQ